MKISYLSLRGGGIVCSHQQLPKKVQLDGGIDDDLIQHLIHDIECKCQGILDASKRIGLNESRENIMMNIGWFHKSSQFIHQIRQNSKMVQENIKIVLTNLEVLLEAIINIIQSQRFYTWLILKICNAFSLLIFIYYINNPNPPMKLQDQEKLLQYLAEIQQYLKVTGQSNSYENSIQYEFELLQMCIQTCPTNSKEGQEIIINTFSGIISSITQMSPSSDLISALGQGALYLYKENSKSKQKEIFQIIFYIEELKWQIIEQIQNGKGLHNILMILGDNYKKLVEKSHSWIIRCSWIKMIAELISHKPLITYGRFNQLMNQYQLDKTWDQIIQQKVVKPIDENKLIGVIQQIDSNEHAVKILQQQYTIFEQLQNVCLNGNQDIPKFENLIQFNEKEQQEKNTLEEIDKIFKLQQSIENIKINELQGASQQLLIKYQDYIDGFINLKDYINSNHKQFLQQIDQLSMQSNNINQQLYDYYLQSNIVEQQLIRIAQLSDEEINKNDEIFVDKRILCELIKSYFNIIIELKYNLGSFKEEFEQVCKYFPENKLKVTLTSQEFNKFISDIFSQIKDNDFTQLIIKLELTLKNQQSKFKMNPLLLVRKYTEVLNLLILIIFNNLRSDLNIEQQYLLYFEQLISYDKKILAQNFNQIKIRKQQFYYSIMSVIGHLYEQLSKIVFELKFDKHQAEQFNTLQLSQVLQIYCNLIQLEVNQLSSNQLINDPIQKQDNVSFIVQLLTQNRILQKFKKFRLESSQQISQIKSKINKLKSISDETNQKHRIIDQLIKNKDLLNNYLNLEDNQDKLNLMDIFSQRIQLLNQIKESQYDIDHSLIENTIKINKILELEGFQQKQQVQLQIIQKSKENLDLIIQTIINQHDQKLKQDEVGDLLDKVLLNIDQIIIRLNDQQIIQQNIDENQYQSHCNQLILKISQCMQNEQEQNENLQMEIEQEYDKIIQEFKLITIFSYNNMEEIIQGIFDIIRQLPSIPIPDEYIQNLAFGLQQNKTYEQKAKKTSFLQTIQDSLNKEQWRIKEYFYFNSLIIYESVNNQGLKNRIGQIILYGKFKETDFRVIQTLKNQEYKQQMEQLINHLWQESKEDIKVQLQDSLNKLQNIQLQLQGEERKAEREKLQQQHRDLEDQIEQQLKNVNEIGDLLGITINFLKDIQKDLAVIQKKLDNILNQIESMGQDIKFLRGKSPQQLLEIRMEQVISNKIMQDSQSVYVQIFTKECDIESKREKDERTPLFNHENYDNGEVDEFLDQPEKSSLLIHGIAGAGKSLSARKIEEHLWIQYQKKAQNKQWDQIKDNITIPIFIQLPALKEPKFIAIEETLESAIYQFDQKQINQLKELVQSNNKIKLLFIMDSYDELAKQYQQINLIQTNKVNQWKHLNEKNNPKVITTSRSEIFTNTYRSWFYGDNSQNDKSLKEIRLLSFDEEQRFLFLKQYSQLQLKLQIKELLEIISKNQQSDYILQNTLLLFDKIQLLINQEDQFILSNQSCQQIIETISKHPNMLQINKEQQKSFQKQLSNLWSAKQYEAIIKQLNLKEMLETPFFMNIVVAVLPQMNEKLSSQTYIKIRFSEYYKKNKILQIQNIISNYECNKLNYQDKYELNEIQELKQIKHDIFIIEAHKVWDCLIDSNFFKHFNAQKLCTEIIALIEKSFKQRKDIFSTTEKEQDNQNYLAIYNSLITKTQTIYNFYEEFLNSYIEQQRQKLSYSSEISDQNRFLLDIHEYSMKLAVAMTKQNETVIEIKQQGILFRKNTNKDHYSEFFQDQDKYGNYRILIRKCLPLKQKANFYQFHHKSIQEFLFAKQIVEFLQQISQENQLEKIIELRNLNIVFQNIDDIQNIDMDFLYSIYNNSLNQDFQLSTSQMQGQLRFIKAALQYQSKLQNTCYLLSLLSSICTKFLQISSNALFIYTNLLLYVENKDFSKIQVENISLDGINFVNCNFSDSQLKKVSINGINLISSNLKNINWFDCYSNDLPNFRGTQSPITCLCFLGEEKYIVCGNQDGSISLWNKQQAKILNQFMANKDFQIIDIIPQQKNDEIQYVVFLKQYNDRKFDIKLQFWKVSNHNSQVGEFTSTLIQDVQIDSFYDCSLWSHNNQYLVYNQLDQIFIYDLKNLKIQLKEEFTIYFQLSDNNLIYMIVNENICVWNFIENIKQNIRVNKLQEVMLLNEKNNNFSYQFKFSRNFQFLAMESGQDFYLFNIESNSHIQLNLLGIQVIEFSQNQQYLGIGGDYLVIFDIQNQCITQKLYGLNEKIQYIYFNTNVTEIITLSKDGLVQYWDLQQCLQSTQQLSSNLQVQIDQIQYSINGQLFFVQTNGQIYVYDSNTGLQVDSIEFNVDMFTANPIQDEIYFQKNGIWFCYNYNFKIITKLDIKSEKNLIISPDGILIWTFDDSLICEPRVFWWVDFVDKVQIIQIDNNKKILSTSYPFMGSSPCFSKDCQTVYYFNGLNILCIEYQKDSNTGIYQFLKQTIQIDQLSGYNVRQVYLSPDDQYFFLICAELIYGSIKFYYLTIIDKYNKKICYNKKEDPLGNKISEIAFQQNNKYVILTNQSVIKILNCQNFQQIGQDLFGHIPYTKQVIQNPNRYQFITLGEDNKIKIWEHNKNFNEAAQQKSLYYLKATIPQKSIQNVLIHESKTQNAKILSHLGYNILEKNPYKFNNPYIKS